MHGMLIMKMDINKIVINKTELRNAGGMQPSQT